MKKTIFQKPNGGMVDETTLGDKCYCPEKGDIISLLLDLSNEGEIEQMERKVALVVSPKAYNNKTHLALVCPIQTLSKAYPFEIALPVELGINGFVLTDHLHSLNWLQRRAVFLAKLPELVLSKAIKRIQLLIE